MPGFAEKNMPPMRERADLSARERRGCAVDLHGLFKKMFVHQTEELNYRR